MHDPAPFPLAVERTTQGGTGEGVTLEAGHHRRVECTRVRGEEEEEAVSQSQRAGSIMGEIGDSPLTGRKSAARGDKRCGSRIFCLPAWPFLKSLLLMTHTQWRAYTWGLASPCTESVLSPASWLHHRGSRSLERDLCILPANAGLMCSPGLV